MTDIECPRCGHRALRVATRCPRCGHEFSEEQLRHRPPMPGRKPFPRGPIAALGLALLAVAVLIARGDGRGSTPAADPPDPGPDRQDTVAALAPPPISPPRAPDSAAPAPPDRPVPASSPTPARRRATQWVNVRESRGVSFPVVRVLEPGDAVLVDSLRRGWYRVLADGRAIGYAHRRYLEPAPPDTP